MINGTIVRKVEGSMTQYALPLHNIKEYYAVNIHIWTCNCPVTTTVMRTSSKLRTNCLYKAHSSLSIDRLYMVVCDFTCSMESYTQMINIHFLGQLRVTSFDRANTGRLNIDSHVYPVFLWLIWYFNHPGVAHSRLCWYRRGFDGYMVWLFTHCQLILFQSSASLNK